MKAIKNFFKWVFTDEWEVTIYYKGDTKVLPDGTRIENGAPNTYKARKLIKITDKHFIFVDTDNVRHEIKLVESVSYQIKKTF